MDSGILVLNSFKFKFYILVGWNLCDKSGIPGTLVTACSDRKPRCRSQYPDYKNRSYFFTYLLNYFLHIHISTCSL